MPAKPKPKPKRPGRRRYFFLAILLAVAAGLLWDGSPLASLVLQRALALKFSSIPTVTPGELVSWMQDPNRQPPLLIDTRTRAEYEVSHLAGAVRLDPTEPDVSGLAHVRRDQTIVFYCSTGLRSTAMAIAFKQQGYTRVYNLAGGLFRWANEGRPLFKESGSATQVHPYSKWAGYLLKKRYRAEVAMVE